MPLEDDRLDISLVLACYNEAPIFSDSVHQIIDILEQTRFSFEIIFVDDCSQDNTRELILEAIGKYRNVPMAYLFHEKNTGRGQTVADGFRISRGDIVGYIDIDLEVHARYIPSCVSAIHKGADVATANRLYTIQLRYLDRQLASRGYKWLMRKLLKVDLQDTETGFKFFKRERFLPILDEIQNKGWFWDTESMVRAHIHGLKIEEIPCLFIRRFDKVSSVRLVRDTLEYWRNLWRFKKTLKGLKSQSPNVRT